MANIGLAPVGAASVYYPLATNLVGGDGKTPISMSVRGTVKEQDIVPTFKQSIEGVASVTDSPPTAEAAWRDFSGSIGLYRQSDAPGDTTRPYLCDADNSRPGQVTAWLRYSSASDTVVVDNNQAAVAPIFIGALVNDVSAPGFVGMDTLSRAGYWQWNGTKFAFLRAVQAVPTSANGGRLPVTGNVFSGSLSGYPFPTVQPTWITGGTASDLWMPCSTGGSTNIAVMAAAGVGVNSNHNFVYFDILFALVCNTGSITVTPYRPNTPGAANVLQSVTYAGLVNSLLTIPGESICLGVAVTEGAAYIVTDRSCHAMQWNDNTNTFTCSKLFELPRFTSAPAVWNGEVYIGAEGRVAHITPGQRGYDWRIMDPMGTLPPPYSSTVVQLIPSADALYAVTVDAQQLGSGDGWAILRLDANGAWTVVYSQRGNAHPLGALVPMVSSNTTFALASVNTNGTATVFPLPTASRNPRTLVVAQRAQRAGPFSVITPYYDLASETAQKQLERFRTAVTGVSATYPIRVYYQTDYADEQGADTFPNAADGVAKGTGTWHKCGYFTSSGSGYSGTTDASGNGAIWFEFDNATSYADGIATLPLYPTYKRVRWMMRLLGDTSGTTVPTLLSHAFHRLEYVTKAYQRQYTIRLRVGELQGVAQTPATTSVSIPDSTTLKSVLATLKGFSSGKTVLTEKNEWGDSKTVVMTKYDASLTNIQANGAPGEYIVNITLMDVPLVGQN